METKEIGMKDVINRLARLQSDVDYLKQHVKDEDIFLSAEEEKLLEESYENDKAGKLVSSARLRKELGI